MLRGSLTGYVDIAQVALYVFWGFFAALIFYLRREDHREGYPMVSEIPGSTETVVSEGFPVPPPKMFRLYHGGVSYAPQTEAPRMPQGARPAASWPGAPLEPTGNPLIDGIGPASFAYRLDEPDLTIDGLQKLKPMRMAPEYRVDPRMPHPQGMRVIAADGIDVGTVVDVWIDEIAHEVVFLEVELRGAEGIVLIPHPFVRYRGRAREVLVRALLAAQFPAIPRLRRPDTLTRQEEERLVAYFGGGLLYATSGRLGPVL